MRAVLVPGALALLPEYAGLEDPVAELRAACLDAVRWLGPDPVVLADAQGMRVAAALLAARGGFETTAPVVEVRGAPATSLETPGTSYLVVGNGSARRSEKAPGHLDERALAFDEALGAALASSHAKWPSFDPAEGLLACLDGIGRLRAVLPADYRATVDYDDDPYGVQYWVMRWEG